MLKQIKSKEERLKEGLHLLNQLREAGVSDNSSGFIELKYKISEWVSGVGAWDGTVDFREYRRVAEVDLPKYDNRPATINFKMKRI